MASLVETSNNRELLNIIREHNLEKPKFMIGDKVKLMENWKELHIKYIKLYYPSVEPLETMPIDYDHYDIDKIYTITKKFKHSKNDPWWSYLENGNYSVYLLDECLHNVDNLYKPRKLVYESFNDFIINN